MTDSQMSAKLDHLIALYELVNGEALARARTTLRADPINNAVLNHAEDWTASGKLKSEVATACSTSEKSVQRRILELVERGAIAVQRADGGVQYRRTGVV